MVTQCNKKSKRSWENDTAHPAVTPRPPNRKNTSQGRFLCGFCPYRGADNYRLTIHLRIHTGDKPFKCELCDYQSTQKSALTVHTKRRHLGVVKIHECSLCSQRYANKRSLNTHMLKHTGGEMQFKCEDCSYSCASAHHMVMHKRTHSGERPYACDKCPHRFALAHNLKSHQRMHSGHFIRCPHKKCKYKCVQPRDLKRHLRKHTGDLYDCSVCDYQAPTKGEVRLHLKKHARRQRQTKKNEKDECGNVEGLRKRNRRTSRVKPVNSNKC